MLRILVSQEDAPNEWIWEFKGNRKLLYETIMNSKRFTFNKKMGKLRKLSKGEFKGLYGPYSRRYAKYGNGWDFDQNGQPTNDRLEALREIEKFKIINFDGTLRRECENYRWHLTIAGYNVSDKGTKE